MKSIKQIVIIGPESTGKTTLVRQLAEHFKTVWIPEYAREYVEKLDRPYNYEDVEEIAKKQYSIEGEYLASANQFLFIDTDLIITKIWFEVVFGKMPDWLAPAIEEKRPDLYLLCATDLPWQYDPVRENGGEMRDLLFEKYKKELENLAFPYKIVDGVGGDRLQKAIQFVLKA